MELKAGMNRLIDEEFRNQAKNYHPESDNSVNYRSEMWIASTLHVCSLFMFRE
jgi:hypothetical protein